MSSWQLMASERQTEQRRAPRFRSDMGIDIEWVAASLRGSVSD